MAKYDVTLQYNPGKENQAADTLSRCAFLREEEEPITIQLKQHWISRYDSQKQAVIAPEIATQIIEKLHAYLGHLRIRNFTTIINCFLQIPRLYKQANVIKKNVQ